MSLLQLPRCSIPEKLAFEAMLAQDCLVKTHPVDFSCCCVLIFVCEAESMTEIEMIKAQMEIRDRRKKRERILTCWFTPQMPMTAGAGLDWRKELGTQSRTPTWWQRSNHLSHHHSHPVCISRAQIRSPWSQT